MTSTPPPVGTGLCICGCGLPTTIAEKTNTARGWVAGQPRRYRKGHSGYTLKHGPRYLVDEMTGCWVWQRSVNLAGYAIGSLHGKSGLMHRLMYEKAVAPIPAGLTLHHVCSNPPCVNPAHMQPMTLRANNQRQARCKMTDDDDARAYVMRAQGLSWRQIGVEFDIAHTRVLVRVRDYAARNGLPRL